MVLTSTSTNRLTSDESMDTVKFTDLIYVLLKNAWGEDWGVFTDSKPTTTDTKDIKFPQIVYEMKLMTPGLVGKSTREIKPRYRSTLLLEDEGNNEESIQVKGQVVDCLYAFYVYGTTNKEAESIAIEFANLMSTYTGFLKRKGLRQIILSGIEKLQDTSNSKETYSTYLIQYKIQLEILTEERLPLLKAVSLDTEVMYKEFYNSGNLPSQKKLL